MAVTKLKYLDEAGVQEVATYLLQAVNYRIRERIRKETDYSFATDSTDDLRVLSSKAVLALLGNIGAWDVAQGQAGAIDPTSGTFAGVMKAMQIGIGESTDTAGDNTVYGAIAAVQERISGLSHLTYEVVEGEIETEVPAASAKTDVIYLQHDEPFYSVGSDDYLLAANGSHATANDGVNDYEAYLDPADGKVYKMVNGVKGAELASDDAIFANVAMVEDNTYTLYIANPTSYAKNAANFLVQPDGSTVASVTVAGVPYYAYWDGTTEKWMKSTSSSSYVATDPAEELLASDLIFRQAKLATVEWLPVGDTSLDLGNYWTKKDTDVEALKNLILEYITDTAVKAKVQAAFDATTPISGGAEVAGSYANSWS